MIPLHSDTAGRARVRTTVGVPVGRPRLSPEARAAVRRLLEGGPFMAGFKAGMYQVRDIALDKSRVRLVRIEGP
jgi:hypothetical protein